MRLSVLLLRDQGAAEEVVQDAFVAMHGRWSRLRDPTRRSPTCARPWSTAPARRCGTAAWSSGTSPGRPHHPTSAPADEGVACRVADVPPSSTRCAPLPDRQREVLALRYYLDLSEAEIADTLGIARGSVKAHASRGAAALRALLADQPR